MNPVRILAGLAVVLAAAPLWLAHAGDDRPASAATAKATIPSSPPDSFPSIPGRTLEPVSTERTDPFPGRSFEEIIASVEQGTGCLGFPYPSPLGLKWLERAAQQNPQATAEPKPSPALPAIAAEDPAAGKPETSHICHLCLDPPSEAEVWAKVPKEKDHPANQLTQRNNIRILIENIVHKVDPVKVYPLAGACQLVHCHYKCTVYYDDLSWDDLGAHVDHKVHVIYIDKDHLRRARPTQAAEGDSVDDRIDRASREIEDLKRTRRRDRREQEQLLDRLIKELEGLKRELRDETKGSGDRSDSRRPGAFSFSVGGIY